MVYANTITASKPLTIDPHAVLRIATAAAESGDEKRFLREVFALGCALRHWGWEFDNAYSWVTQNCLPTEQWFGERAEQVGIELLRGLDFQLNKEGLPTTLEATA